MARPLPELPELLELTDEEYERAVQSGSDRLANGLVARRARYDARSHSLVIYLSTGANLSIPVRLLQGLEGADKEALSKVQITPAGTGIRFLALDADFSLDGLIEGVFGTQGWMKSLAARGGRARTEAKRSAARANGKKGGRPRRQAVNEPSTLDA